MEMMMKGDMIDAQEAYRIGLVNKVVTAEKLMAEAENTMRVILSKPQPALAALIEATNAANDNTTEGFKKEAEAFSKIGRAHV